MKLSQKLNMHLALVSKTTMNQRRNRIVIFHSIAFVLSLISPALASETKSLVIWDDQPADEWYSAYPIGNGRLGAMPFSQFPNEKILINEETIWARTNFLLMPEDSFEHLEKIRQIEAAGDYEGADRHLEEHLMDGSRANDYQLMGWLNLSYLDLPTIRRPTENLI